VGDLLSLLLFLFLLWRVVVPTQSLGLIKLQGL
jgi:hypothetical protein